jgi:hypothetical protein
MRLEVSQEQRSDGTRRTLHITDTTDGRSLTAYFDFIGESFPRPYVLDGFANAVLFYAMRTGQDILVDGPMSRSSLLNLAAFQQAWSCWKPDVYAPVNIEPSSIEDDPPHGPARSIAAFSGGADSIFTVLCHARDLYSLDSAMLVHGFDVPTDRADDFNLLIERVRPVVGHLNLRLRVVRTNIAELRIQDWADSFLAQLSCCLHNYSHEFRYGLAGSGEPYNALVLPWGQNPCTDYLLSGNAFSIVHDGAAYSRTEKVAVIAKDPIATRAVKVCWAAADRYTNCGTCEKCIRTRMNFRAVGVDNPSCFDGEVTPEQIRLTSLGNETQRAEFRSILAYANAREMRGDWLEAVQQCLLYHERGLVGRALTHMAHGDFSVLMAKIRRKLSGYN